MVKDRNARLADQAEKIAALKRARETGSQSPAGENKLGTSFVESDDVGPPLAADRRKRAKKVKSGEGDKGDRPRPKRKATSKGRKKAAGRKGATRKSARRKGANRR
jgi:hypothetical protein